LECPTLNFYTFTTVFVEDVGKAKAVAKANVKPADVSTNTKYSAKVKAFHAILDVFLIAVFLILGGHQEGSLRSDKKMNLIHDLVAKQYRKGNVVQLTVPSSSCLDPIDEYANSGC